VLVVPYREFLLAGLTAAVITFLLVGPVRVLALKLGAVAWPRGRDVHVTPTPRWGGLAMLGGVLCGVLMAYQLPALRLAFDYSNEVVGVMIAAVLLAGVGALDDRYDLDALTKFAGQVMAAGVLIIFGVTWVSLWVPWGGDGLGNFFLPNQEQGLIMTVVLTVALVNAMNFVDGLDGLAAGIGAIAAVAIGLFTLGLIVNVAGNDPSYYSPALLAAVLAGACVGFLPHNFNPARIFMGDSGSMLVGLLLAAATTLASGKNPIDEQTTSPVAITLGLFAPVIVLASVVFIPLLDLLMAVVRRTRNGMSPFAPDKMHLHHRLLEIGHSHRRAVLLIYLWAGVLAFGAVALSLIDDPVVVLWAVGIGLLFAVLASAVPRARRRSATAGDRRAVP
jgi:UDP-GlcNAc:undecaprenyl-phosphate/decaprenyl-phosphate GlcNAc-1-phosphate transferase